VATTTDGADARLSDSARELSGRPLTPAEIAWLATLPCALVVLAAVVLLGPPLGRILFPPTAMRFWVHPIFREPTEHARFLLAVAGPLLLSAVVVALVRRAPRNRPAARVAVHATRAALLAFVVFAVVAQHTLAYHGLIALYPHRMYFTATTFVVAALVALLLVRLVHLPPARTAALLRETPRRRLLGLLLATLLAVVWLLSGFNTEGSIGYRSLEVIANIPYWLDEAIAILNGQAPLVSFHAQYGQLWPYALAGIMGLLGTTLTVYATTAAVATTGAMLAVYATFRRVVGSSYAALGLFLPFLATGFFKERGTLDDRYAPTSLYSLFPIRYGGAYLLAWLVGRQLDRARPRRLPLLFFVAGLVAIDNTEFGGPAFLASFAALAWTLPRPVWPSLGRLVVAALAGLLGALAAVAALTLAVAGALPRFGLLVEFSRLYALGGFGMLPMPALGIHLAIYATFAGALVLATTRALSREDRLLTGLLCWAGVFGLGAGSYYAGRSHPEVLIDLFSAWAFTVALLLVAVVRALTHRASLRPTAAELAVLLAFGVAVCSLAQTPTPWSQVSRIAKATRPPIYRDEAAEQFVRRFTRRGEQVGILAPLGHRIARDVGIKDIVPYANIGSMPAIEQWDDLMRTMDRRHVRTLFVFTPEMNRGRYPYLLRHGWNPTTYSVGTHLLRLQRSGKLSGE
jgi:hypothetical protein